MRRRLVALSEVKGSHDGKKLADVILQGLERLWQVGNFAAHERPRLVALVSDGAANMIATAAQLKVPHIHCAAHVLNLCLQVRCCEMDEWLRAAHALTQGMKKDPMLQARLLQPTLALAKFFKTSGPANDLLKGVASMLRNWAQKQARDLPEHTMWPLLADESRVADEDMKEYLLQRARVSARDAAPPLR